ncbi:MAG: threonine-phosphate decarboxylase [Candidatus Aureabacteria bacterium]|nr:threonine-phosphate decarboxylase [Candidatus Auribacterota bacterium]
MGIVNSIHGGNIYKIKRSHKKTIIDFSANINPLGFSSAVKDALHKKISSLLHYPDAEYEAPRRAIAKHWNIKKENILIGNGSVELIYLIMNAFKPSSTLIPVPTFSEYERAARMINSKMHFLKLREKDNFKLNIAGVKDADIYFFCNPNNPTGNIILEDYQAVEKLAGRLVVIDEAFLDFLPDERKYSFIQKAVVSEKIIVLRSLTKFFALPGLRIGYLVAHKNIIQKLKPFCSPWNVNSIAQIVAPIIINDKNYKEKTRKMIKVEKDYLCSELSTLKSLFCYSSVTNFLLLKIMNKKINSSFLTRKLLQKGILIRDCTNFRGLNDRFIRIAVRSHKENTMLIKLLKEICKN